MKRVIAAIVSFSMTFSSITRGEQSTPSVPPPAASASAAITPLKTGQAAPFSGVLFTPRAAASVMAEIGTARERTRILVEKATAEGDARKEFAVNEANSKCTTDKEVLGAMASAEKKRSEVLSAELEKLRGEVPSRGTWLSVGLVGGTLLTAFAVFVASRVSK